jgi:hypothetical protein
MKKAFMFMLLLIVVISTFCFSGISTIYSIGEIKNSLEIDKDTLVIFDIDEVLITNEDLVERSSGYKLIPQKWKNFPPSQQDEIRSIMLKKSNYLLVDSLVPDFILELKEKGIKSIALTSNRSGRLGSIEYNEDRIENNLLQKGIDFKSFFSEINPISFDELVKPNETPPLFKNGILFVSSFKHDENEGKGKLLGIFLDRIKWSPKKVIFFDDDMDNLLSVQNELEKRNITYLGYHFKGAELLPNTFDERIMALKYYFLSQKQSWLTNEEAIEILSKPYNNVAPYEK